MLRNARFAILVALRQFCEATANNRDNLWTGEYRHFLVEAGIEQIIIDLYRLS
ncbi:MAG: hypothetical protein F6K22_03110 [Okeania sp. SIO2F4]|uniref:hypothetical protein n=1 Tax=Okeania sp. SIO2F4 TaxID=2607790 RepID=UPI00142CBFCC|nr:hypothetical protein [Okeania sp. SIO2F4]MDJ0515298.1 hypothetical protein [Trichodesmium sp. MO_231.B1]NES01903.1 hypothetical protein [Okeania sp. SIO2F4]